MVTVISSLAKPSLAKPMHKLHTPVLLASCLQHLSPLKSHSPTIFIDATFGAGGYTKGLLDNFPSARVIALDRDPLAISLAYKMEESYKGRIVPVQARFGDMANVLATLGVAKSSVDGIVFDIGVSSMQLDTASRGFSFLKDGPLDMRMSGTSQTNGELPAHVILNTFTRSKIEEILRIYGEEYQARKIATAIDKMRTYTPITSTLQLATLVTETVGTGSFAQGLHPATKTFQALRIYVNDELDELYNGLKAAEEIVRVGGMVMCVSFHSLEDRLAKRFFKGEVVEGIEAAIKGDKHKWRRMRKETYAQELAEFRKPLDRSLSDLVREDDYLEEEVEETDSGKKWEMLSRRVVRPTAEEISDNPRARSAKLRPMIYKG